jgi:diaminohydroxyphosphoribosylaminopyrimidine deaminase/5-amino-6-(5-phosphoribosylamino)uracil reductase
MKERRPFVILKAATSRDGCIAEAPGRRTALTSGAANQHAHRVRAEVDAIGVGSGTILVDDPLLTPRGPFRPRPLTRVIFDRELRTPSAARVLSTLDAGPVMIVTTEPAANRAEPRSALESRGAEIVIAPDRTLGSALRLLGERGIASLLIEGGAALHAAAWDEGVADFVRMYVTPHTLGAGGVRFLADRPFSSAGLHEARVELLGPDVLIEGYVHGPR